MNDYHVTLKVSRGKIKKEMDAWGIKSVKELARQSGAGYENLNSIINFKVSPRNKKDGGWKKAVRKVSEFFCYRPEELFPSHLNREIPINRIEAFADRKQIEGYCPPLLESPQERAKDNEDYNFKMGIVKSALSRFSEREQYVITERFLHNRTRQAIGDDLGVTGSRVWGIEKEVLQAMKSEICA